MRSNGMTAVAVGGWRLRSAPAGCWGPGRGLRRLVRANRPTQVAGTNCC